MRLLKLLLALAACGIALIGSPRLHAANGECEKDVFIYFDVSGSMSVKHDNVSTLQLFTSAIDGLLSREDFAGHGDRVVVIGFTASPVLLIDTTDVRRAAAAVRALAIDEQAGVSVPNGASLNDTSRTSVASVLDDILRRYDPNREQVFIIASDFADDPENNDCENVQARIFAFKGAAERFRAAVQNPAALKLIPLTTTVPYNQCSGNDKLVSEAVVKALHEILQARQPVEVNAAKNVIADELRRAAADAVTLSVGPPPESAAAITITVSNPNPFPVAIDALTFSSLDDRVQKSEPAKRLIGCRQSSDLTTNIPPDLYKYPRLAVGAVVNTPAPKPLEIPSGRVVISKPELYVFSNLGDDTYAVELILRSNTAREINLTVEGIAGKPPQKYHVPLGDDKLRAALAVKGTGASADGVVVTSDDSSLYVLPKDGEPSSESAATKAQHVEHEGEEVPFYLHWAGVISAIGMLLGWMKVLPGGIHRWWKIFHLADSFKHLTHALGLGPLLSGIGTMFFAIVWPYGRFTANARVENILWAAASGGLALFAFRSAVIFLLWNTLEPRLRPAKSALAIRLYLGIVAVILAMAVSAYVFILLSGALGNSKIFHPVSPS